MDVCFFVCAWLFGSAWLFGFVFLKRVVSKGAGKGDSYVLVAFCWVLLVFFRGKATDAKTNKW